MQPLAREEVLVVAAVVVDRAVGFDFDHAISQTVHELAVVRDEPYS